MIGFDIGDQGRRIIATVRAALRLENRGAFLEAAREVKQEGTFDFARTAVPYAEINAMFKP